jgi:hypothetical protein
VGVRGSRTPVEVGFPVGDGAEAYYAGLGFANVTTGNMRNQVRAIVAWVNAHGGLAGHPIQPVFQNGDTSRSAEQNEEAACATFTQDHHVFAAVDQGGSPGYVRCLAKAGVIDVASNVSQRQALTEELKGLYWAPPQLNTDRFVLTYLDQLYALGFFSPGAKLGLLAHDTTEYADLTAHVVKPWLARHHLTLTDSAAMSLSNAPAQGTGFAFQFNAKGVTHIINLAEGNIVYFMQAAENQQYRPRYALSSRDGPGAWVQLLAPARQLQGSIGVGWSPLGDVDLAHNPGDVSPNQALCRKVMSAAGENMTNQLVVAISHRTCEGVLFLYAAASRIPTLSTASFIAGARGLGTAYRSVLTFGTRFGPQRYDGVAAIRPLAYQTSCSCFTYQGPVRPLSG